MSLNYFNPKFFVKISKHIDKYYESTSFILLYKFNHFSPDYKRSLKPTITFLE